MFRIGIDVGGTNTDAALLDNNRVIASAKAPTSKDVITGVVNSPEFEAVLRVTILMPCREKFLWLVTFRPSVF